jgi:single-strand DNA-binding protein
MASYNKLTLIGNVGNDPVFKVTPNGNKLAEFSIAYSENRGGANKGPEEKPIWFKATVWGDRADTIKNYVTKGMSIMVEGRLSVNPYIGQDGVPRQSLEIRVSEFVFLGTKADGTGNGPEQTNYTRTNEPSVSNMASPTGSFAGNADEDELPF